MILMYFFSELGILHEHL